MTSQYNKAPALIIHTAAPFNAEPPLSALDGQALTPTELFFVRNHATIPEIAPSDYRLTIDGLVAHPLTLTLDDLRTAFPQHSAPVTLQCAGNRRADLQTLAPIRGEVPWGHGAISTGAWRGPLLSHLLAAARVNPHAQHVEFIGADAPPTANGPTPFGASIPLAHALYGGVFLAHTLHDEALPPIHGAPVRALVPGYIGARSVKWLTRITLRATPSDNHFQANAYRLFPPHCTDPAPDPADGLMLGELPINAVITAPADDAACPAGRVVVCGFACAGTREVARVDVTADDGTTWITADLLGDAQDGAWRLWQAELTLAPGTHTLAARAWDTAANTQPSEVRHTWNIRGYMNNAWHRVCVSVS